MSIFPLVINANEYGNDFARLQPCSYLGFVLLLTQRT